MNEIKDKITTSHKFCKWFWYLLRRDLKSFSITFCALSLIFISLLSVFECITCSSSLCLEEIILVEFSTCEIFRDYLWYLLSILYPLIFIFSTILTPYIIYSDWFIIIFFFFFMFKNISNISKFFSLFALFPCFSLKGFVISLTVLSFIFYFSI